MPQAGAWKGGCAICSQVETQPSSSPVRSWAAGQFRELHSPWNCEHLHRKPATHQTIFMCRNASAGRFFERTASMKIWELWSAVDDTQTCVAGGYKHVRRRRGLREMTGRLWLPCMQRSFREHQALGAQVISHSFFFSLPLCSSLSPSLSPSCCLWSVSSATTTYPVACLSPGRSPGQTDGNSSRPPAVKRGDGPGHWSFSQMGP